MTASSPARPSTCVPAATCCQQARKRTKSATLAGSTCLRRRPRLAAWRRTSRWRAHQRPSGSSMAEPAASSRASPVRARATVTGAPRSAPVGSGSSATSCSTVTGPDTSRWPPTHSASASSAPTRGSHHRSVRPPRPCPAARWRPRRHRRPGRPARPPELARTSPARPGPAGTGPGESRRSCSSSGVPRSGSHLVEHLGHGIVVEGPELRRRHGQARGQPAGPAARGHGGPAPPACGAPRGARRRGRCRGVRSGCRGRAGRARPTRPGARRPGPTRALRAGRPGRRRRAARSGSRCTVWRTSTWSGTATGPGAAFSWQAASAGQTAASRSSASMRWRWIGRRWPPRERGTHQRPVEVPPPPGGQHRVGEDRLGQDVDRRPAVQHRRHL